MKLISKGWQYRVYDIGNGKVKKIKRTLIDSFGRIFFMPKPAPEHRKFRFNPILSLKEMRRISRESDKDIGQLKKILPFIPGHFIGNPVFLKGINYKQDSAIPLLEYFKEHNKEMNNKMITKYVELLIELWKFGCSDNIFNFPVNSGVAKNGQVIMIDIGEFVFSKNKVKLAIQSKKWLSQPFYAVFKSVWSKKHFRKEMDRLVTIENLNKNWRLKIQHHRATLNFTTLQT